MSADRLTGGGLGSFYSKEVLMPWSNQNGGGGGPWGGGGGGGNNQGPWGQGPNRPRGNGGGGGGNQPPDLEDLIRRGQDRLKNVVPGGFNGGAFVIIGIVLVAFWLMQAVYTVQPDERGVELRFGKPLEEVAMPGLHFHLWPVESVEIVKVTEQQQNIGSRPTSNNPGAGLMLSGDQNIVSVQFSVLYTVSDPQSYLFNLEDPTQTLQQVAESAMREVVGRRPAQDVFRDNREEISTQVRDIIQGTMDTYGAGIAINAVPIEDAARRVKLRKPSKKCSAPSRTKTASSKKPTSTPTSVSVRLEARPPRSAKRQPPTRIRSSRKRKVRRSASFRSTTNTSRHPM